MKAEIMEFVDKLTVFADENIPKELGKPLLQLMVFPGRPPTFSVKFDFVLSEQDILAAEDLVVGDTVMGVVK